MTIRLLALLFTLIPLAAQELFQDEDAITGTDLERIYVKGIQHLARTQTEDGSWPDRPYGMEPAVVGLCLTAMLAHGDDPNTGPYADNIRRGLDFILKQQNKETGYIGRSMYNHGFSTLALAEAYGAVQDDRLGPALERAIRLIVSSQDRNPQGAWRYSPESQDADTTVTGAQLVALFAARNAGLAVNEEAIQKGLRFLQRCQGPEGGIGYTSASGPNGTRSAIAVLAYALAKDKNSPVYAGALRFLQRAPSDSSYQHYNLYYASQAFFHAGPQLWKDWNAKNIRTLRASQNPDGSWDGSFGSTFATCGSLLSMALNYRYLPIYER